MQIMKQHKEAAGKGHKWVRVVGRKGVAELAGDGELGGNVAGRRERVVEWMGRWEAVEGAMKWQEVVGVRAKFLRLGFEID